MTLTDIELMEPIYAEVFPGNSIDAGSYSEFIRDNDIRRGIIVADKGFPVSRIREELADQNSCVRSIRKSSRLQWQIPLSS